jgi:hypothetical protein
MMRMLLVEAYMSCPSSGVDPVPQSVWPSFQHVPTGLPNMPEKWSATVLLHPFSPPQSNDPDPTTPFFELCLANLAYIRGLSFSAQILGCTSGNRWRYETTPFGTKLSYNGGAFQKVEMGWSVPASWFGMSQPQATCAGSSPLNWMTTEQPVDWWRAPVPGSSAENPAATWVWLDSATAVPVRMMFGQAPPSPSLGNPQQLAVLQMYSFTYFAEFSLTGAAPREWTTPVIDGFSTGNPGHYGDFVWSGNFGMTAFMTPVNETYNPLPARVLYVWKSDEEYSVFSDRAQSTLMDNLYNTADTMTCQEALLTGAPPASIVPPPPNSDTSFLINYYNDEQPTCKGTSSGFDFPQEPPDWISLAGGTIQATITNHPVLCPNQTVTIFSVLFPPAGSSYPDSTYLWTWYVPQEPSGATSRPVTFMQSASKIDEGTSLALGDYFYWSTFDDAIDAKNFCIPPACNNANGPPSGDVEPRRFFTSIPRVARHVVRNITDS